MAKPARFKQSDCTRALRAAVAAGLKPCGYEIDPNGTLRVIFANGLQPKAGNSFDEVLS